MTFIQVHNHFPDFETDPVMMECLEKFEAILEREKMNGQLRMLNFACAEKVNTSSLMTKNKSKTLFRFLLLSIKQ